jgi:phospholipase/carboxylesterase
MTLDTFEMESGPAPQTSLIILHGLGADGRDFVPFCQALDVRRLGAVRFVMPSAPVMPVSINGGYAMQAWYDILPVQGPGREHEPSLRTAQQMVQDLIEREITRGIRPEHIVLMGFSQGCAMTLMTGLRCPHTLGGLIALSGYLPLLPTTAAERHAANQHTPIFMAHGLDDDVVALNRGELARDHLRQLGYAVTWHDYPIEHSMCMDEVEDINAWLLRVLCPA